MPKPAQTHSINISLVDLLDYWRPVAPVVFCNRILPIKYCRLLYFTNTCYQRPMIIVMWRYVGTNMHRMLGPNMSLYQPHIIVRRSVTIVAHCSMVSTIKGLSVKVITLSLYFLSKLYSHILSLCLSISTAQITTPQ